MSTSSDPLVAFVPFLDLAAAARTPATADSTHERARASSSRDTVRGIMISTIG